jgi:hypothetical protein
MLEALLIDEIRIFDLGQPRVIPVTKHAAKFDSRRGATAGHN